MCMGTHIFMHIYVIYVLYICVCPIINIWLCDTQKPFTEVFRVGEYWNSGNLEMLIWL